MVKNTLIRQTWAEINLDAIGHNIEQVKKRLRPGCEVVAVVKANGYGHGSVEVAKKALRSGASSLAVSLLEEALTLREANIDAPILVLGWVGPEYASIAAEQNITLTFSQKEWVQAVKKHTLPKKLNVHMKWDTGMGRTGIRTEKELKGIIEELNDNPSIYLTGVYTHFATADSIDPTYYKLQRERFEKLSNTFKTLWKEPVEFHMSNSAASIQYPDVEQPYIRLGISMYGLYPSKEVKETTEVNLKQAFSLHSQIVFVKKVPAGECISYGGTYRTESEEWIGTIPIGYGDGWIRKLTGMTVLIDGKRMPIVGRICMDMMMVRLDQEYEIGTKVTLIGKQGDDFIDMDEIADKLDTINYEIPCTITARVPRIYTESES